MKSLRLMWSICVACLTPIKFSLILEFELSDLEVESWPGMFVWSALTLCSLICSGISLDQVMLSYATVTPNASSKAKLSWDMPDCPESIDPNMRKILSFPTASSKQRFPPFSVTKPSPRTILPCKAEMRLRVWDEHVRLKGCDAVAHISRF